MPTPVTHAVVGASFSTLLPRSVRGFPAALGLGFLSAAPDLDIIGFFLGVPYSNTFGHRGVSHSLPFALMIAAALVLVAIRFRALPYNQHLRLFLVFSAAIGSHGLLDMATDGGLGVGIFLPLFPDRLFFPFRPIVVSPISPRLFLAEGAPVVVSELLWVWTPIIIPVALVWIWRKPRSIDPSDRVSDDGMVVPARAECRQITSPTPSDSEAGPEEPRLGSTTPVPLSKVLEPGTGMHKI